MIIALYSLLAAVASAAAPSPTTGPTSGPAAAPAAVATAAAAPASTAKSPQDPDQKIVCKMEVATGSRLGGKRICATRAEWAEVTKHDREQTENFQQRSMTWNPPGN